MSKINDWTKKNCKFAQAQAAGVTADHLMQAAHVAIKNVLVSMGQNNPDIQSDVAEAETMISDNLRKMMPSLQVLSQQLTEFFTRKSQERAAPQPGAVQQAVENPQAPPAPLQ